MNIYNENDDFFQSHHKISSINSQNFIYEFIKEKYNILQMSTLNYEF